MKKIRLLTTIAGHWPNFHPAGSLYDCSPAEAARLIAAGQAIAVEPEASFPPAIEAAAIAPPDQATAARPSKRKRKSTEIR